MAAERSSEQKRDPRLTLTLLAALVACACTPSRAGGTSRAPLERVIVVSVDGLQPEAYTAPDAHGLAVPLLREMARRGAHSPGARSVFPAVTYPAHTSVATGVEPGVHGIVTNTAWDPREKNKDGWWWYAEDIKARTLWDAAADARVKTALVNWPVTVGARAALLVPEYWRAGTPDDAKIVRALATPGLLPGVAARFPDLWRKLTPPNVADEATADIVVHLLETARPRLLLAHIWQTDDAAHAHGPWSPEARAAIENADRQLARIVAAARAVGPWERTAVVVLSDHGFTRVQRQQRPGALLRDAGLVTLGHDGRPTSGKVSVVSSGGLAFFYLADPTDRQSARALEALLRPLLGRPGSGVGRLFTPAEVRERGGDPRVALAAEAAPGFTFAPGYRGDAYGTPEQLGQHGFDPERADMNASLLIWGGALRPQLLPGARLVDVAPTVAGWLGLSLPATSGRPLPIELAR